MAELITHEKGGAADAGDSLGSPPPTKKLKMADSVAGTVGKQTVSVNPPDVSNISNGPPEADGVNDKLAVPAGLIIDLSYTFDDQSVGAGLQIIAGGGGGDAIASGQLDTLFALPADAAPLMLADGAASAISLLACEPPLCGPQEIKPDPNVVLELSPGFSPPLSSPPTITHHPGAAEAAHLARLAHTHRTLAATELALGCADPADTVLTSRSLDTLRFAQSQGLLPADKIAAELQRLGYWHRARVERLRRQAEQCTRCATALEQLAGADQPTTVVGEDGLGLADLARGVSFWEHVMAYCGAEAAATAAYVPTYDDWHQARRAWRLLAPELRDCIPKPTRGYGDLVAGWYRAVWAPGFAEQQWALLRPRPARTRKRKRGLEA